MSRYGYDYSLMPSRPAGWRSVLTNVLTVGAIAAASAISGGVVALELLGSPASVAGASAITASAVSPAPARTARAVRPPASQQASAQTTTGAVIEQPQTVAPAPQTASQPAAVRAAQPTLVVAVAAADQQAAPPAPESDLTFTSGYARRRAVQAAAASSANIEVAKAESETQMGRGANKAKPKVAVARANGTLDQPRTADARAVGGAFARFDQPEKPDKFDFGRHQALAFGDPRQNRRAPPQQSGGQVSNSSGGFFGGLF